MSRLADKVCVVTGAAQGIGAVYAKAMAQEGAKIVVSDIEDSSPVAAEIEKTHQGAEAIAVRTDVSDENACQEMVAKTVERFGRLDVLVSNAAIFGDLVAGPFEEITVETWDKLMAVNVKGPFLCAKAAVPQMRQQKSGKIINIASGTLFKGAPNMLHYVTSKGAILAMTRSLSREVGSDDICVNTLAPGFTMSEKVIAALDEDANKSRQAVVNTRALKRDQMPEDLIGALIFLASSDSDFMTGQCMVIDGGSVNH